VLCQSWFVVEKRHLGDFLIDKAILGGCNRCVGSFGGSESLLALSSLQIEHGRPESRSIKSRSRGGENDEVG